LKIFVRLIVFVLFLFSAGCKDNITDIGGELIPTYDRFDVKKVSTDTLNVLQKSNTYQTPINLGAAPRTLLGKYRGIKSTALLRFYLNLPDSLANALRADSLIIKKTWIQLDINYYMGDPSSYFNFTVHRINQFWMPDSFNADSLKNLNFDSKILSTPTNPNDSIITVPLPESEVFEWLKQAIKDSLAINNGLLLLPDEASEHIVGFQGLSKTPQTLEPILKIIYQKPGAFTDTLNSIVTHDVNVITGTSKIELLPGRIQLQGEYALRSLLYFKLDFIPTDAIINKADLKLFVDSNRTIYGSVKTDSLIVQFASDSTEKKSDIKQGKIYLANYGSYFKGEITRFIQSWINGTDNQGLILRVSDEQRTINFISIYGSDAVEKKMRPQLTIYYTDKK